MIFSKTKLLRLLCHLIRTKQFRVVARLVLRRFLDGVPDAIFTVKEKNKIVGYCIIRPLPSKYKFGASSGYMVGPVYVADEVRGRGAGSELLMYAVNQIGQDKRLYAYILIQNKKSIHVFEKSGFKKIGYMEQKEKNFYLVEQQTAFVLMEKRDDNKQEG